jgi:hypothetical protein
MLMYSKKARIILTKCKKGKTGKNRICKKKTSKNKTRKSKSIKNKPGKNKTRKNNQKRKFNLKVGGVDTEYNTSESEIYNLPQTHMDNDLNQLSNLELSPTSINGFDSAVNSGEDDFNPISVDTQHYRREMLGSRQLSLPIPETSIDRITELSIELTNRVESERAETEERRSPKRGANQLINTHYDADHEDNEDNEKDDEGDEGNEGDEGDEGEKSFKKKRNN